MKILEILKGQVPTELDGIVVLQTKIERWVQPLKWRVQPLKWWATLLCDYLGVKDSSRYTKEMLDASEVMRWVKGLATSRPLSLPNALWRHSRRPIGLIC